MKKIFIVILTVLLTACSLQNNKTNLSVKTDSLSGILAPILADKVKFVDSVKVKNLGFDKKELESITLDTTWGQKDIEKFEKEIKNYTGDVSNSYTGTLEKARLYGYVGHPGKAIQLYDDYVSKGNLPNSPMISNYGNYYADICKKDPKKYVKYCKQSILYFETMIQRYRKPSYYEDINWIVIFMGEKNLAKKVYNKSVKLTGRKDIGIEKRLNK